MKSILKIVLIVAFAFSFIACSKSAEKESTEETDTTNTKKILPVRTQRIKKETIPRHLDYTANLIAFKEIHYAPSSPGRINKINVDVGNRVSKGQVLVEMDKTQLNQATTQYQNAKINFERVDTLHGLGSISEQQYDQTKTQYEVAKSNYEFLKENTTLLSPLNGLVTGKYFENGELYAGAPNTNAGKAAVLSLMQINPLKAVVNISQSYFPDIKEDMTATITTDIFPEQTFQGTVYKVYPTIDASTRTFKTEILIKNPKEVLRPGMFANIVIILEDVEAMVVPSIAVLKQEGTNNRYVFINNNNVAKQVEVTPGERFDDKIELKTNGVKVGNELIIQGQANLLNGSAIKVIN